MKKKILFLMLFITLLVPGATSDVVNPVTRGYVDTTFCKISDGCCDNFYAGMYLHNESGLSVNFATQNQWYNFTNVNCGLLNGFICNATTGTLTALYDGIYKVNTMGNGEDGNNQIFEMGVAVNNVIQNNTITSDETASGLRTSMNGFGRIKLKVGDKVNLQLRDTTGVTTGILYNVNILIDRSGNS